MNLSKCCIFCDDIEKLETSMSVKVDNINYQVSVCVEHEDDASPKLIRERLREVLQEIEDARDLLDRYGINMGLTTTSPTSTAPRQQAFRNEPAVSTKSPTGTQRPQPVPQPAPNKDGICGKCKMDPCECPPEVTSKKMQKITAPSGQQHVIPETILDAEGGRTEVRIVNTGGDNALQRRFKNMADRTRGDKGPDFRNNYDVKDCPVCEGSGINKVNQGKCPKCDGGGILT